MAMAGPTATATRASSVIVTIGNIALMSWSAASGRARNDFVHGWRPRTHVAGGPAGVRARMGAGHFVEVGIEVVGAVISMKVDRKDPENGRALGVERRVEVRTGQDVVEVVVEHVQ